MNFLLISFHYLDRGIACSNHAVDRVRALRDLGHCVRVGTETQLDDTTAAESHTLTIRPAFRIWQPNTLLQYAAWRCRRQYRKCVRWIRKQQGVLPDIFARWEWCGDAVTVLEKAIPWSDVDIIYSTGGPAVAHLTAHELKRRHPDKTWVAEIQEPLIFDSMVEIYHPSANDMFQLQRVEKAICQADRVICLTDACARDFSQRHTFDRVSAVYPGATAAGRHAPESLASHEMEVCKFLYAGTLEDSRNLRVFADCVRAAHVENQVHLTLVGQICGELNKEIIAVNGDWIRFDGVVSREECWERIDACDVALVIQHTSRISSLTIPSKLYEYSVRGVPVLVLAYANRDIERKAREWNCYFADMRDTDQVTRTIQRIVATPAAQRQRMNPVTSHDAAVQFCRLCSSLPTDEPSIKQPGRPPSRTCESQLS
ncbi:MAG: glycosyltransferase family protein [Pirellulaceae bacterium]